MKEVGVKGAYEGLSAGRKSKSKREFCHKENSVPSAVKSFSVLPEVMQGNALTEV